jgi:chemotaxis protein MotB
MFYSDPAGIPLYETRAARETADYKLYHQLNGYILTFLNDRDGIDDRNYQGSGNARFRFRCCPGFKLVKEERLEHMVNIERKERGVLMRIKGELMFRSGDAHVRYTFQKTLRKISKAIEKVDNQIIIEGHTDDLPIRTGRFPSNWELSSARAGAVVRYLSQNPKIDAKRFTAVGYADTKPIVPNTNAINRSKNRRVELLFVDNKSKEKGESE